MSSPLRILIVGGAIAGNVLAMALRKTTQHSIILVEAGPEESLPLGGGLAVSANGMNALHFIDADTLVATSGGKMSRISVSRGESGECLMEADVEKILAAKFGYSVGRIFISCPKTNLLDRIMAS